MVIPRISNFGEPELLPLQVPASAQLNTTACNTLPTIALEEASGLTVIQNMRNFLQQRLGLVMARIYDWRTQVVPRADGEERLVLDYLVTVSNPSSISSVSDEQVTKAFWLGQRQMVLTEDDVLTMGAYHGLFRMALNGDNDNNRLYILVESLKMTRQSVAPVEDGEAR